MAIKKDSVPREVIVSQLLAALDAKGKVAIVMDVDDLDMFIAALEYPPGHSEHERWRQNLLNLKSAASGTKSD